VQHLSLAFSPSPFVNAVFKIPVMDVTLPTKDGAQGIGNRAKL
jgi:hypothetical protein